LLLVALLGLSLLTVPLAGGDLRALAHLRLRALWAPAFALVAQILAISVFSGSSKGLLGSVHIGSYVLAGVFIWRNRKVPGFWLIGLGGLCNFAVIVANGGVMPALPEAVKAAGWGVTGGHFVNSLVLPHARLGFLGDVFALPAPIPLHNVFSVGDVMIAIGGLLFLHGTCRSRLPKVVPHQFSKLRQERRFLRLWGAQSISDLGDWMYTLAVAAILSKAGGGAKDFALLFACQVGPAALVGALGGPIVDRWSRKRLMVLSDVLRMVAVGSLLAAGTPGRLHIYAVAVVLGVFGAIFMPSFQATLPNLVAGENLVAANSLVTTTLHLAVMTGPVLGGFLVDRLGFGFVAALNASSFGLSALLVQGTPFPEQRKEPSSTGPMTALRDGVRYVAETPLVRGIFIVLAIVMLASAVKSPLEPLFVLRTLAERPRALGLVGAAWGIGMVLGSLSAPTLSRRWARERILSVAIGAVGAAVLSASLQSDLPAVLLLWLVAGVGNGAGTVAYESLLQERVPDEIRGRVMAGAGAILDGSFLVGVMMAGFLGSSLGIRGALAASGLLFVSGAVAAGRLVRPQVSQMATVKASG
jgi:MFS transporter, DHA3 family, macrolide efflux protein